MFTSLCKNSFLKPMSRSHRVLKSSGKEPLLAVTGSVVFPKRGGKESLLAVTGQVVFRLTVMMQCSERYAYQMSCERLAFAIPEGIHKDLVVFDRHRADSGPQIEGSSLEHYTVLVVDTSSLRKDEKRSRIRSLDVLPHSLCHDGPVFDLLMHFYHRYAADIYRAMMEMHRSTDFEQRKAIQQPLKIAGAQLAKCKDPI